MVMIKIVDTFIFYNELDILELRLTELYDYVDHFVLVDSDKTCAGTPKPLYFEENKTRYERFLPKITHIVIKGIQEKGWGFERQQRGAINIGLEKLELSDDDIIIFSDADEIPDVNILIEQRKNPTQNICRLVQEMYYYNLECRARNKWFRSKLMPYHKFKLKHPEDRKTFSGRRKFSFFCKRYISAGKRLLIQRCRSTSWYRAPVPALLHIS